MGSKMVISCFVSVACRVDFGVGVFFVLKCGFCRFRVCMRLNFRL